MLAALGIAGASSPAAPSVGAGMVSIKLSVHGAVTERMTLTHVISIKRTLDFGCAPVQVLGRKDFNVDYNGAALGKADFSKPGLDLVVKRYASSKQLYTEAKAITLTLVLRKQAYYGSGYDPRFRPTVIVRAGGHSGSFRAGSLVAPGHGRVSVVGSWHCDSVG